MNTNQLMTCVKQDKDLQKYCLGVFPADMIPQKLAHIPACYIANTDPSSKPGMHWFGLFIHSDGSKEFFDSYGRPLQGTNCNYNSLRVQGPLSSTCGQYVLYYLCHKVRGRTMSSIVNDFSVDYIFNDLCVTEFINRNFDLNTETYELGNIISQISRAEQ